MASFNNASGSSSSSATIASDFFIVDEATVTACATDGLLSGQSVSTGFGSTLAVTWVWSCVSMPRCSLQWAHFPERFRMEMVQLR